MTPFPVTRLPIPRLEKPPVFVTGSEVSKLSNTNERIAKLNENLRLGHVTEGADEVRALCREYHDVFKLPGDKLTATSAAMHSICTPSIPEGRAITLKNYRLAEAHKQEVNDQVEQMIRDEVIAPSTSEWNFPLVIVPKKIDATGKRKWRVCVDFRKLNELSIGDSFPLPNIQDILDKVGRARYFSALDCASGFHQIPIREDKHKTAFSTPTGHFEYLRMPFGLKAAPATFQGMIGKDKPIAYASRMLHSAELNYSTVEKECLVIVWACKHFRPYLLRRKFQILTDHRGLTWIFHVKDPSSRLLRWKLLLEEYEIKYKPGKQNTNADSLSRYPVLAIEAKDLTSDRKMRIIKEMHSDPIGGHQGINRTVDRIKLYMSWPNIREDVASYIRTCEIRQKMKHSKENRCQLQITDTQEEPWKKLYLDVVGPLPCTEEGHTYILTCQDNLSKYLIAEPLRNQTVEEVSEALTHRVLLVYGIPGIILTDQGSNFMSGV
jgi:hypothetical protein